MIIPLFIFDVLCLWIVIKDKFLKLLIVLKKHIYEQTGYLKKGNVTNGLVSDNLDINN